MTDRLAQIEEYHKQGGFRNHSREDSEMVAYLLSLVKAGDALAEALNVVSVNNTSRAAGELTEKSLATYRQLREASE